MKAGWTLLDKQPIEHVVRIPASPDSERKESSQGRELGAPKAMTCTDMHIRAGTKIHAHTHIQKDRRTHRDTPTCVYPDTHTDAWRHEETDLHTRHQSLMKL